MVESPIPEVDSVIATIAVAAGVSSYVVMTVLAIRSIAGWLRTARGTARVVMQASDLAKAGYAHALANRRGRLTILATSATFTVVSVYICARWVAFSMRQNLDYTSGWPERFALLVTPAQPGSIELVILFCLIGAILAALGSSAIQSKITMWVALTPIMALGILAIALAVLIGGAGLLWLILGGLSLMIGRGGRTEEYWTESELPEVLSRLDSGWQLFFAGVLYLCAAMAIACFSVLLADEPEKTAR